MNGHNLKPGGFAAALAVLIAVVLASCSPKGAAGGDAACGLSDADFRTEGILEAIPVRATFLDEVSWDIPHQNWGVREWDADFRAMKNMGINTVVLIRAGLGRWIAAPFECLLESEEVYYPPVDLVEMFLTLADKYGMECWTNIESFDRDMPIRFLPIKWEKLLLKLDAARRAGMQNVITFEFSHFMSPNSAYPQAGHLYDRYCDYFKIDNPYRKR